MIGMNKYHLLYPMKSATLKHYSKLLHLRLQNICYQSFSLSLSSASSLQRSSAAAFAFKSFHTLGLASSKLSLQQHHRHKISLSRVLEHPLLRRYFHVTHSTSSRQDPHQILGVSSQSTQNEIKVAYYKLAKQYHPDSSSNPNIAAFQKVQEAYETLTDPKKRREYERERSFYKQQNSSDYNPQYTYNTGASTAEEQDFEAAYRAYTTSDSSSNKRKSRVNWYEINEQDFFSTLFGNWRSTAAFASLCILLFGFIYLVSGVANRLRNTRKKNNPQQGPKKGADLQATLKLSFVESILGCSKSISYFSDEVCTACNNTGRDNSPNARKRHCTDCRGLGYTTSDSSSNNHDNGKTHRSMKHECTTCGGEGRLWPICQVCSGTGVKSVEREVEVKVPANVTNETNLRLVGMGDAGRKNGKAGDLRLSIVIEPDSRQWSRKGDDIHSNLPVDLHTAINGGSVNIETIHGTKTIQLPPSITHGQQIRVPACGALNAAASSSSSTINQSSKTKTATHGDHVATINILIPSKKDLTPEQQQWLEQLKSLQSKEDKQSGINGEKDETGEDSTQKLSTVKRSNDKKSTAHKSKVVDETDDYLFEEDLDTDDEEDDDIDDLFEALDVEQNFKSQSQRKRKERKRQKKRQQREKS